KKDVGALDSNTSFKDDLYISTESFKLNELKAELLNKTSGNLLPSVNSQYVGVLELLTIARCISRFLLLLNFMARSRNNLLSALELAATNFANSSLVVANSRNLFDEVLVLLASCLSRSTDDINLTPLVSLLESQHSVISKLGITQ
ncbi:MAG: hypothetical protein ACRC11_04560, partial [Xenococcaceae cyanobacterium]